MPWYERANLLCPACRYDVVQTLRDGFYICPECGGPITEESCRREVELIPGGKRRLIYAAWSLPLVGAVPTIFVPSLWWLIVLGALAVYASWVAVVRWLNERGAWRRAIVPTMAVLLLEVMAVYGLVFLAIVGVIAITAVFGRG
jgi:hypothetical protein